MPVAEWNFTSLKYIDIFAAKMWVAFAMQKLLTFFQQKMSMYLSYFKIEILMSR